MGAANPQHHLGGEDEYGKTKCAGDIRTPMQVIAASKQHGGDDKKHSNADKNYVARSLSAGSLIWIQPGRLRPRPNQAEKDWPSVQGRRFNTKRAAASRPSACPG